MTKQVKRELKMSEKTQFGFVRETQLMADNAHKQNPDQVYTAMQDYLDVIYPDVHDWVHDKVIPGLVDQEGKTVRTRPDFRSEELKLIIEFGAKIGASIVSGCTYVDHVSWDAYNESSDLGMQLELYKKRFGMLPKEIQADKIYLGKEITHTTRLYERNKLADHSYAKQLTKSLDWIETRGLVIQVLHRLAPVFFG